MIDTGTQADLTPIQIQQAITERAGAMRAQHVVDLNAARRDVADIMKQIQTINTPVVSTPSGLMQYVNVRLRLFTQGAEAATGYGTLLQGPPYRLSSTLGFPATPPHLIIYTGCRPLTAGCAGFLPVISLGGAKLNTRRTALTVNRATDGDIHGKTDKKTAGWSIKCRNSANF